MKVWNLAFLNNFIYTFVCIWFDFLYLQCCSQLHQNETVHDHWSNTDKDRQRILTNLFREKCLIRLILISETRHSIPSVSHLPVAQGTQSWFYETTHARSLISGTAASQSRLWRWQLAGGSERQQTGCGPSSHPLQPQGKKDMNNKYRLKLT